MRQSAVCSSAVRPIHYDAALWQRLQEPSAVRLGEHARVEQTLLDEDRAELARKRGDLFVADSGNRKVRKINLVSAPVGQISTVAGTGALNSTGNGGPAATATFRQPFGMVFDGLGNLYIADYAASNVRMMDTMGYMQPVAGQIAIGGSLGDNGAARDAYLYLPVGVAVSANSQLIYIVDHYNDRVRVVGP